MQLAIVISGVIASILFIISGISYFLKWGNFRIIALGFLVFAISMFILMIIRNVREEWTIGSYKPKDK